MTGYGAAEGESRGLKLSVELKSVNNRYLDIAVRMPRSFLFAEEGVKSAIQSRVSRGKLDVFINVDSSGAEDMAVAVNAALARGYAAALKSVAELCGLKEDFGASVIARFPDVLTVEKPETDNDGFAADLGKILSDALDHFNAMRRREGEALCADIERKLCVIEELVARIAARSPETVKEYRERLLARMTEVLGTAGIEEQRILQEAAVYADRVAVDEELVRLGSHIAQARKMLKEGSPVGRKLDFLIQEFNREANTCGSKCADGGIARTVVDLKAEIEKIREQVQNIE